MKFKQFINKKYCLSNKLNNFKKQFLLINLNLLFFFFLSYQRNNMDYNWYYYTIKFFNYNRLRMNFEQKINKIVQIKLIIPKIHLNK